LTSRELAERIAVLSLDKKALKVIVLDLHQLTPVTDYFVICSGESELQVKAIVDHIEETLRTENNLKPWHVEGYGNLRWVLMDYVDVVAHVFRPEVRDYYGLERLWGDAPRMEVSNEEND